MLDPLSRSLSPDFVGASFSTQNRTPSQPSLQVFSSPSNDRCSLFKYNSLASLYQDDEFKNGKSRRQVQVRNQKTSKLSKTQQHQRDQLSRKIKRLTAYPRGSVAKYSQKSETLCSRIEEKSVRYEDTCTNELREEVCTLRINLEKSKDQNRDLHELLQKQEEAFKENLSKLSQKMKQEIAKYKEENEKYRKKLKEKDYEIDKVVQEIDRLKSRLGSESTTKIGGALKKRYSLPRTKKRSIEIQTEEMEKKDSLTESSEYSEEKEGEEHCRMELTQLLELKEIREIDSLRNLRNDIGVIQMEKRYAVKEKRMQGQLGIMKRRYAEVKKELSKSQDISVQQEQVLKELSKLAKESSQALLSSASSLSSQDIGKLKEELKYKKSEIQKLKQQIAKQIVREETLKEQLENISQENGDMKYEEATASFERGLRNGSDLVAISTNSSGGVTFGGRWVDEEKGEEKKKRSKLRKDIKRVVRQPLKQTN